jgi:hypothetical protein
MSQWPALPPPPPGVARPDSLVPLSEKSSWPSSSKPYCPGAAARARGEVLRRGPFPLVTLATTAAVLLSPERCAPRNRPGRRRRSRIALERSGRVGTLAERDSGSRTSSPASQFPPTPMSETGPQLPSPYPHSDHSGYPSPNLADKWCRRRIGASSTARVIAFCHCRSSSSVRHLIVSSASLSAFRDLALTRPTTLTGQYLLEVRWRGDIAVRGRRRGRSDDSPTSGAAGASALPRRRA